MKNIDVLNTLFVGIDVGSQTNAVYATDFYCVKTFKCSVDNNQPGTVLVTDKIAAFMKDKQFNSLVIAMESTSVCSTHIANFLSTAEILMPFKPKVRRLNPKTASAYKKTFIGEGKLDSADAFALADFARVGKIRSEPRRGSHYLALQRLARRRLRLVEAVAREKNYMLSNIYLKFSELAVIDDGRQPFSNKYGATASAVLTEFLSTEDIASMPLSDLTDYVHQKGHGRFTNPEATAQLLQQAARNSYRLDKCLYEPITLALASSFNCLKAYEKEVKVVDNAILQTIKGFNTHEYQCSASIPGIGPVYAAGVLPEIGTIKAFKSHNSLAKYAGAAWPPNESGKFQAGDKHLSKQGNAYLRYYLLEAANSVKNHLPDYKDFYSKKYAEASTHKHKRALAPASRKLIRLIFGLLDKNQLYTPVGGENLT
ncbi:MAG: IS110 family transposase [Clostridiales bacterium]|jgi:transposase|nr:IS110 family transposase [Clostridiales bacterium]